MSADMSTDMLPFVLLQKSIKWSDDGKVSIEPYNPVPPHKENHPTYNQLKDLLDKFTDTPFTTLEKDFVFLAEGLKDDDKTIKTKIAKKVGVFKFLHDVAQKSGLHAKGVFGTSFIAVGTDKDKLSSYGKSKEHLDLGSLNIPSENLGFDKDKVNSFRQYFYFSRARSTDDIKAPGTMTDSIKIIPSEVSYILHNAENKNKNFLTQYEAKSFSLFLKNEWLLLYLLKNIKYLNAITEMQKRRLLKKIGYTNSNGSDVNYESEIPAHDTVIKYINSRGLDAYSKGLYEQEAIELWVQDHKRMNWLAKLRTCMNQKEVCTITACQKAKESILAALENNSTRTCLLNAYSTFKTNLNFESFLEALPAIDLPYQAYMRLMIPFEEDKSLLRLAHMIMPVNYSSHDVGKNNHYLKFNQGEYTLFMVVALEQDVLEKLDNEDELLKDYSQLLGIFSAISLELLTIPEISMLSNLTRTHSIKSAISAVMSRNGSHNIGSHVINRVVEVIDSTNVQAHGHFFRYLQQRLDFLAMISTQFSPSKSPQWFAKEVMRGFYIQEHLLNFIARSEGIKASDDQVDQNPILKTILKVNGKMLFLSGEKGSLDDDVQVALPGDIMGCHALYTILENFIRNSAKHGYATHPAKAELKPSVTIELKDNGKQQPNLPSVGSYAINLWDNWSHISTIIKPCKDNLELLKQCDFDLSHYNLIWPDDICNIEKLKKDLKSIFSDDSEINILYEYCPLPFREKLINDKDIKENISLLVKVFNGFIWNNSASLNFSNDSENEPEIKWLQALHYKTNFQRRRLNRLFIESLLPSLKKALPLVIDQSLQNSKFHDIETFVCDSPSRTCETQRQTIFIGLKKCLNENKYNEYVNNEYYRIVEDAYWNEMIQKIGDSNDKQIAEKVESLLQKYYSPLHWKINHKLENGLIDKKDGKLKQENWGLAEMKICAAFLYGCPYERIGDEGKENLGIVKAMPIMDFNEKDEPNPPYRLGYEFYITKPVDVVWVGALTTLPDLENHGIIEYHLQQSDSQNEQSLPSCQFFIIDEKALTGCKAIKNRALRSLAEWLEKSGNEACRRDFMTLIEELPVRFFLVTDNEKTKELIEKDEFFKKRIVLIDQDKFSQKMKSPIESKKFKLWLYIEWLKFLAKAQNKNMIYLSLEAEATRSEAVGQKIMPFHEELKRLHALLFSRRNETKEDEKRRYGAKNWPQEFTDIRKKINDKSIAIEKLVYNDDPININKKMEEQKAFQDSHLGELSYPIYKYLSTKYGIAEEQHVFSTLPKAYDQPKEMTNKNKSDEVSSEQTETSKDELLDNLWDDFLSIKSEPDNSKINTIAYIRHHSSEGIPHLYHEELTGNAAHFTQLLHFGNYIEETRCRLVENGLLRVAIADERVLDSPTRKAEHSKLVNAGLRFTNQFFNVTLFQDSDKKAGYVDISAKGSSEPLDILIVHQGILDKLDNDTLSKYPSEADDNRIGQIEQLLIKLKENIPFIIVTSGRGKPVNLPAGVKFIPFSQVEANILTKPHSKYTLTNTLTGLMVKSNNHSEG